MHNPKVILLAPSIKKSLSYGISDGASKVMSLHFGTYPPLGLCYIAGALRKHNIPVEIIDIDAEGFSLETAVNKTVSLKPDIIGITSMSFTFLYALELARLLKSKISIPIIIGGNHVSLYPEEVLNHDCFDMGVIGEGEQAFLEIAMVLTDSNQSNAKYLKEIKGIVFRENNRIVKSPPRELIRNIDMLPFPEVGILKIKKYCGCNLRKPYMTMLTSRGCPFRCLFCSKVPWGDTYRHHSAERVISEIERLIKQFGIKSIDFFDDTFTISKERVFKIAELIRQKNLRFEFGLMTRADLIDKELLTLLKRVGCKIIAIGVESGSQRILRELNKDLELEKAQEAFKLADKIGIRTVGFFMIGNRGESLSEIDETIRFIKRLKADWFKANILVPYPGTQLYNLMLHNGELKEDYWRNFTLNPIAQPPPLANRTVDKKELIRMRNYINLMPYLRVRSNIFKLHKIKSFDDLKRGVCNLASAIVSSDNI